MITREADYAIRVALYLSKEGDSDTPVSTAEMAEAMGIPYRFLRKIIRRLVLAEIITSQRGRGGGIRLARDIDDLSILEVIQSVDPKSVLLNRCLDLKGSCGREPACPVHREMKALQQELDQRLKSLTFRKLLD